MDNEEVSFSLTLEPGFCPIRRYEIDSNTPLKSPKYSITFNDTIIRSEQFLNQPEVITFTQKIEPGDYCLSVNFLNKDNDTIVNESGHIIHDLHIKVIKLLVNDIEITHDLQNSACEYLLDEYVYFKNEKINKIVGTHQYLSWNGSWNFRFKVPFYLWLLDTI